MNVKEIPRFIEFQLFRFKRPIWIIFWISLAVIQYSVFTHTSDPLRYYSYEYTPHIIFGALFGVWAASIIFRNKTVTLVLMTVSIIFPLIIISIIALGVYLASILSGNRIRL
ncbi:MAG: hypothetical protein K5798_03845 [Nitrosopumilus sp.]|uniref:hypothetical protein n=1 Tax=Nitrosopumilus sp. TaxID=2024843 RepID=UPI00242E166A|nr:hypothetical protein [Nitrosopumilus sp.]MCV0366385.1 hypothetical protein [Nitrosopumilus sp.]